MKYIIQYNIDIIAILINDENTQNHFVYDETIEFSTRKKITTIFSDFIKFQKQSSHIRNNINNHKRGEKKKLTIFNSDSPTRRSGRLGFTTLQNHQYKTPLFYMSLPTYGHPGRRQPFSTFGPFAFTIYFHYSVYGCICIFRADFTPPPNRLTSFLFSLLELRFGTLELWTYVRLYSGAYS